jgi:hypothetical protein
MDRGLYATNHSTKSTWGDWVRHVTSTFGDVPFTRSVLKSELRSLTLIVRDTAANAHSSIGDHKAPGAPSPIDTAKYSGQAFGPEVPVHSVMFGNEIRFGV